MSCLRPGKAGCTQEATRPTSLQAQALTPAALLRSPNANTSASAARWGKSLPAELDRSPAALPPPRQHPSLTPASPLLALPPTLTPSAGADSFTGTGSWPSPSLSHPPHFTPAGRVVGRRRGGKLSLGPQRNKTWQARLLALHKGV